VPLRVLLVRFGVLDLILQLGRCAAMGKAGKEIVPVFLKTSPAVRQDLLRLARSANLRN
jgi:hypothetical protein